MHLTSPNFTSDISSDSPHCALCTFRSYDHCYLWGSILWKRDHSVKTASLATLTSSRVMLKRAIEVPHDLSRSSYRELVKNRIGVQSEMGTSPATFTAKSRSCIFCRAKSGVSGKVPLSISLFPDAAGPAFEASHNLR